MAIKLTPHILLNIPISQKKANIWIKLLEEKNRRIDNKKSLNSFYTVEM